MKTRFYFFVAGMLLVVSNTFAQTTVNEIVFNTPGISGDDSDPYRLRKVNGSSNNNWLELQINDDADESFRIYGNSCVGYGCGVYSGNLYHLFDASGNVFHSGKLGFGMSLMSRKIGMWDDPNNWYGMGIQSNQFRFQVGASGRFSFLQGDNSEVFTVQGSGSVGIGTASPSTNLEIVSPSGSSLKLRHASEQATWGLTLQQLSSMACSITAGGRDLTVSAGYGNKLVLGDVNFNTYGGTVIVPGGNVGIGTSTPDQKLTVNGTVHATRVKVETTVPGPDYVFEESYALPTLDEVKSFIDENKHLPDVPSAKEMEAKGIDVGEMNMLLLKKVEELTLYVIELKKENEKQQIEIEKLKK